MNMFLLESKTFIRGVEKCPDIFSLQMRPVTKKIRQKEVEAQLFEIPRNLAQEMDLELCRRIRNGHLRNCQIATKFG